MRVLVTLFILVLAAIAIWTIWRKSPNADAEAFVQQVIDDHPPPISPSPTRVHDDFHVESTAYCITDRPMANGRMPFDGAAAKNLVPFGTKYLITSGPLAGKVVQITDRHKPGSTELDIWLSTCEAAKRYGRRTVGVVRL
jgi:hypothetical protein